VDRPLMAVDCDGVLLPTSKYWWRYLMSHSALKHEYRFTLPTPMPYNLSELFILGEGDTGFEFFNHFQLYDNLEPREDAVFWLEVLNKYYDIVVVSKCMGNHHQSKVKWIEKYFPYVKGIYCTTTTKAHVLCDVFVDDSVANLNQMCSTGRETTLVRFRADYYEPIDPLEHFHICYNWEDVYNYLMRINDGS